MAIVRMLHMIVVSIRLRIGLLFMDVYAFSMGFIVVIMNAVIVFIGTCFVCRS